MPASTRHFIIEYRRLSDNDDFQFAGVIGEGEGGEGLEYRHKKTYAHLAKVELDGKHDTLESVLKARFGPLVSRTTTISSRESIDTMFAQYLAVERHGRLARRAPPTK